METLYSVNIKRSQEITIYVVKLIENGLQYGRDSTVLNTPANNAGIFKGNVNRKDNLTQSTNRRNADNSAGWLRTIFVVLFQRSGIRTL